MKRNYIFLLTFLSLSLPFGILSAQFDSEDSLYLENRLVHENALEDVIVETYYAANADDATDTDGGELTAGSITYRIYIDLADSAKYSLTSIYGNADHELKIATSTTFFNNEDRGDKFGSNIPSKNIGDNTVALDSWVTLGAATDKHFGILKSADPDGSIVGGANSDGGSEGIDNGLLSNDIQEIGVPVTTSDGLVSAKVEAVNELGMDLSPLFDKNSDENISSFNGAFTKLGGVKGFNGNQILIAQLTTTGSIELELNIQVLLADSLIFDPFPGRNEISNIRFTAREITNDEIDKGLSLGYYVYFNEELKVSEQGSVPSETNEEQLFNQMNVFPNPSSEFICISGVKGIEDVKYSIYDTRGILVKDARIPAISDQHVINTSYLAPGAYFLKVFNRNSSKTIPFIKE